MRIPVRVSDRDDICESKDPNRSVIALFACICGPRPHIMAALRKQLSLGAFVVVTALTFAPLLDVLIELANGQPGRPSVVFAGLNPFGSCLHEIEPCEDTLPVPGVWGRLQGLENASELNGRDVFVVGRATALGRWQVRLAGGREISIRQRNIVVEKQDAWPPKPTPSEGMLRAAEVWRAVHAHERCEAYEPTIEELVAVKPRATNAFWLGIRSSE